MIYLLYTIHVLLCIFLILVVLLQQGKGADLSVFGGGSTMAAFGARSGTTLLHRLTVGAFVAFVLTTLVIAYVQARVAGGTVMDRVPTAPAAALPTPAPRPQAPAPATPGETPQQSAPQPAESTPPPAN